MEQSDIIATSSYQNPSSLHTGLRCDLPTRCAPDPESTIQVTNVNDVPFPVGNPWWWDAGRPLTSHFIRLK
eukprot:3496210-Amphidinium_carterae.1